MCRCPASRNRRGPVPLGKVPTSPTLGTASTQTPFSRSREGAQERTDFLRMLQFATRWLSAVPGSWRTYRNSSWQKRLGAVSGAPFQESDLRDPGRHLHAGVGPLVGAILECELDALIAHAAPTVSLWKTLEDWVRHAAARRDRIDAMAQQRSHPWPGGVWLTRCLPRTTVDAPKTGPPLHCAARDGPKGAQYVERDMQHATRRYGPPGAMYGGRTLSAALARPSIGGSLRGNPYSGTPPSLACPATQ